MWAAIIVTAIGCYLLKLAGLSVPDRVLDRPYARRLADLIPVALLGAVIAVETFPDGLDSLLATRLIGVAAGMVALLLKAPFIVVVFVAAATAALLRLVF